MSPSMERASSPMMAGAVPAVVAGPAVSGLLKAYLDQVSTAPAGYRAIQFHLSLLQPFHRQAKHLQIAANMLVEVLGRYSGRVFVLRGGDIVAICKGVPGKVFNDAAEVLRYLFNDDPLAKASPSQGTFFSVYDLELRYHDFMEKIGAAAAQRTAQSPRAQNAPVVGALPPELSPVDHVQIGALLADVSRVNLSAMVRRQTIWLMRKGEARKPAFDELFVSIPLLREALPKGLALTDDYQLFRYVTRWLDRYMLKNLIRDHSDVPRPLSVNVNLETLLSPEYRHFDERRPVGWRDRLMFEIQFPDVWTDFEAFLSTARLLRERGYLRCLDGVIHNALPYIDFGRLDVDFVKVFWDDALLSFDGEALRDLRSAVESCGPNRIILSRCGRAEAIAFGQALGIQLFQGRCLDR